jgi:hypothetical protein
MLVAFFGLVLSRSFTSNASFEAQSAQIVTIDEALSSGKCPLDASTIAKEPTWLIEICGTYGLTAYSAAQTYPEISPQVFGIYGNIPEFREVLSQYGQEVIPVVAYFVQNGSQEMLFRETLAQMIAEAGAGEKITFDPAKLTPEQYGLLSIMEIKSGGHGFLDEFNIVDGVAQRIQVTRVFFSSRNLLAGGLVNLEKVLRADKRLPTWGEIGEAALDGTILLGAGAKAFTLIRDAGKVARAGEVATDLEDVAALSKSERAMEVLKTVGKTTAVVVPVGLTVFAITHPTWTTHYAGWIAEQLGLSWWVGALTLWLIVGGVMAFFLPFLVPIVVSIVLWLTLWVVKICTKMGFRFTRFAIAQSAQQIRRVISKS